MSETDLGDISSFRGCSGEVVREFVSFATLLTLLPVAVLMAILGAGAVLFTKLIDTSPPVTVFIVLLCSSPIVGRFAMAARQGDLAAGFLSTALSKGDVMGFVFRHAALVLVWGVPIALLSSWLMQSSGAEGGVTMSKTAVGMALLVVGVVGQSVSLLVATKADSFGEVMAADMYRWVWSRRKDWAPFLAALLGGAALFTALAWPVLGLLTLLLVKVSPEAALLLGGATYAAPGLAAPVLFGRLCGAFVFGEEPQAAAPAPVPTHIGPVSKGAILATALPGLTRGSGSEARARSVTPAPVLLADSRPAATSAVQAIRRIPVDQALGQLRLKAESDLPGAVKEAGTLREAHPAHPQVAAECARVLVKAGVGAESRAAVAAAIDTALKAGAGPMAAELFLEFGALRRELPFQPATLEALARTFLQRNQNDDSLWCYAALARANGDPVRVQKGLIAVADSVARAGDADRAKAIFDQLLVRYPDSSFASYIDEAKGRL